jgi:hypothetical protein
MDKSNIGVLIRDRHAWLWMSKEKVSGRIYRVNVVTGKFSCTLIDIEVLSLLADYDGCQCGDAKAGIDGPSLR